MPFSFLHINSGPIEYLINIRFTNSSMTIINLEQYYTHICFVFVSGVFFSCHYNHTSSINEANKIKKGMLEQILQTFDKFNSTISQMSVTFIFYFTLACGQCCWSP